MQQQLYRLPDVIRITGRGRSSIYSDVKAGRFPSPIKIGPRAVAWARSEIDSWIQTCTQQSRAGGAR